MSKRPLVQRLREEPNFAFWLDIAEAADRIEELEAEVERLRLGLTYVVGNGINTDALEGE